MSPETLAQWRSQQRGPRYYKVGRLVRYRLSDLERYMTQHAVNPLDNSDA